MAVEGRVRSKLSEWLRRYLPLEIAGWIGLLGSAGSAYLLTGSLAAAAAAATVGSSVGYYLPAYVIAVRWSADAHQHLPWLARTALSHLQALRSLTVEFGPAESIDSLLVRPMLIYATPLLLNHVLLGWIIGGFLADIAFYVCAICSYERFKSLLVVRHPQLKEMRSEPCAALATA
jgi:hypothetical protein